MQTDHTEAGGDDRTLPLVVDVDGTLISGDLLVEGAARLVSTTPLSLFRLPFWLMKGKAALKREVAQRVSLPASALVINDSVLAEINTAKEAGRPVWLATASDEEAAAPLVEATKVDGLLASDGKTNLVGKSKASRLVEKFGEAGFDYIGNERRDLAIWSKARHAIGVDLSPDLQEQVKKLDPHARFIEGQRGGASDYFRALRPHQWVKNLLVFAPLIAAHETGLAAYLTVLGIFAALSACASGTYLFNDLLDLPHDRAHPTKKARPLAAGKISLIAAAMLCVLMVFAGVAGAYALSVPAGHFVLLYLGLTLAYSLVLKRKTFIDVVALAGLFTLRVLAGGAAVAVTLSPWFLAFSIFIFLALAIVKRQKEMFGLNVAGETTSEGRSYFVEDLPVLASLAAASSFAAVMVLALYLSSPETGERYARPDLLWLSCPLLVYWLGRMVLLANRGVIDDDPVVFAVRDSTSWYTGLGLLAVFVAAL